MEEAGTARRIISAVILTAGAAALLPFLAVAVGFSSIGRTPYRMNIFENMWMRSTLFCPAASLRPLRM